MFIPALNPICWIRGWCSLVLLWMGNSFLGRNWTRKINLPDWYETWYLDQFENAEFVGNVIFFCFGLLKWSLVPRLNVEFEGDTHMYFFGPDIPFLDNFCPKNQNHLPKMKLHTNTNSNMLNSMVMSKFSLLKQK